MTTRVRSSIYIQIPHKESMFAIMNNSTMVQNVLFYDFLEKNGACVFLVFLGFNWSPYFKKTFEGYHLLFSIPYLLIFRSINSSQLDNNNRKRMKLKDSPMILKKKISRKIISITKLSSYCMPYMRLLILG